MPTEKGEVKNYTMTAEIASPLHILLHPTAANTNNLSFNSVFSLDQLMYYAMYNAFIGRLSFNFWL